MTSLPQRSKPSAETIAAVKGEIRVANELLASLIVSMNAIRPEGPRPSEEVLISSLSAALLVSADQVHVPLLAAVAIYRLSGLEQPR